MNVQEIKASKALKRRFCKDCNIPMGVYQDPYFTERLITLDPFYNTLAKWSDFVDMLSNVNSSQDYFEYYNAIKDRMINRIKDNASYQVFINSDYRLPIDTIGEQNLYVSDNDDKAFISIDMKQANFSALNHFSKGIFNSDTWEIFVKQFTSFPHIINSKYIRQVVLGACNPKKQIQYERNLMYKLYYHIVHSIGNKTLKAYSINADEIIFRVDDVHIPMNRFREIISNCPDNIGSLVRVEMFTLEKVGDFGWIKHIYDDAETVKFKCFNAETFHQIILQYLGQPIKDNDLVFEYNGKLAKYLEPIENPFNTEQGDDKNT